MSEHEKNAEQKRSRVSASVTRHAKDEMNEDVGLRVKVTNLPTELKLLSGAKRTTDDQSVVPLKLGEITLCQELLTRDFAISSRS